MERARVRAFRDHLMYVGLSLQRVAGARVAMKKNYDVFKGAENNFVYTAPPRLSSLL
ncbi:MAG: hypothetical protein HFACDABA_02677 [Anaerolineales bacterium]|nr:hypothetical protein [Anaerolineales bacterium]